MSELWGEQRLAAVKEMVAQGCTTRQIADRIGIESRAVRLYAKYHGIELNRLRDFPRESRPKREFYGPRWYRRESDALDAEIEASRKPAKPTRYADPELAAACRAIMAYKLKRKGDFRNQNRSTSSGAWLS